MSLTSLSTIQTDAFLLLGLLVLTNSLSTPITGPQIFSGWNLLWAGLAIHRGYFATYEIAASRS